jgi:hypothetical protein
VSNPLSPPVPRTRLIALTAAATVVAALAAPLGASEAAGASHAPAATSVAPTAAGSYVSTRPSAGSFPLAVDGSVPSIVVSDADYAGVQRVVTDLAADLQRVTGTAPKVVTADKVPAGTKRVVIVGTLGHSPLLDTVKSKIHTDTVAGKWETSIEQVVDKPLPGVDQALVIAGGDQRGTIYGAYDVSRGIGVSPYYWWDDVTPQHQDRLYVQAGTHTQGTPAVKYRGFFINDENPSLGRIATRLFGEGKAPGYPGGFNAALYGKVFEVALRLKANYLWPAVWGRAFAEDDPQNQATATRYGIVMGTSHEAPMARGIEEWNRHAVAAQRDAAGNITTPGHDAYGGTGEWSFRRNGDAIKAYMRDGIKRMKDDKSEQVITLGMRGNGDVGLPDGDGIDLMQNILDSEEQLISEEGLAGSPKVWTLYKEVQRYWDKGLRPADDVTVNFTDDNWGNIRHLPEPGSAPRAGGYGLYYHFDYVGGGRNYKWADTVNLANTWEQLHLAYTSGVDRLWVVNVGDLKGEEAPLQFLLDYAWAPDRIDATQVWGWLRTYAAENFGSGLARQVADVLTSYSQLQARRKPELLNRRITLDPAKNLSTDSSAVVYDDQQTPFSLENYHELTGVTDEWQQLAARTSAVEKKVPASLRDAFYELVGYEVQATAKIYQLREAEFTNIAYAAQGRASTNALADRTDSLFGEVQALNDRFNNGVADGKWNGFATQPVLGYGDVARYGGNAPWQQPELNNDALPDEVFPAVKRIDVPAGAALGVAIDGSDKTWPGASTEAVLPSISRYQTAEAPYVDVFDKGSAPVGYQATSGASYVGVDHASGRTSSQSRLTLHVDWKRAPAGVSRVPITVRGSDGTTVTVTAVVDNRIPAGGAHGFVEADGYVAMDAAHATRVVDNGAVRWLRIPGLAQDGDGMDVVPGDAARQTPGGDDARLEFDFTTVSSGPVDVTAYVSPRSSVRADNKLQYAVSVDGGAPQVVDVVQATGQDSTSMNKQWERNTSDNVNRTTTSHVLAGPGRHTLTFWAVDPDVILQRMVVDTGGLRPSYLGPPESKRVG